jgi:putative oxidoreductase
MQANRKTTQLQGWGIAILRVVAGYLFLASGVDKLFNNSLFNNSLPELGDGFPVAISVALSLGELLCGAALVVGLLTRWASVLLALLMLANVLVNHPPLDLFEQNYAYEYALLRLAASVALALTGSGKVALDNILATRRGPK